MRARLAGHRRTGFLLLVGLALVIRLTGVALTPGYVPVHDDADYDRHACWISDHGFPSVAPPPVVGPRSCAPLAPRGRGPTAYRPPLWPAALAVAYVLPRPPGMSRWTAGRVLQALIGTGIAALTGLIALELWGVAAGLVAAGLTAVFVPLVLDGLSLISEPLFVLLVLGAVHAVLRARRAPSPLPGAAVAGVLVGLAALTRANGPVVALPLLAGLWVGRSGWRAPALMAVLAVVVVAPWTIRNAVVFDGALVPVSTSGGNTLYGTYNPTSRAGPRCVGCWTPPRKTAGGLAFIKAGEHLIEPARDARFRAAVWRFVKQHPAYPLQVLWHNSIRLLELQGPGRTRFTAATIDVPPGAAVWGARLLWLVLVPALVGLALGTWRRVPWFLAALAGLLWLSTALIQSETPRFRAPLDPFLLLLAAAGAVAIATAWRNRVDR